MLDALHVMTGRVLVGYASAHFRVLYHVDASCPGVRSYV